MYGHQYTIILTIAEEHILNAVSLLVHTPSRAVFKQFAVNPTWRVCGTSSETRHHFLTECQPLQKPRNRFLRRFKVLQNLMLILGTWCPYVMWPNLYLIPACSSTPRLSLTKLNYIVENLSQSYINLELESYLRKTNNRAPRVQSLIIFETIPASSRNFKFRIEKNNILRQIDGSTISNRWDTTNN